MNVAEGFGGIETLQRENLIVRGTHRHLARDFTWLRLWFLFHGFRAV